MKLHRPILASLVLALCIGLLSFDAAATVKMTRNLRIAGTDYAAGQVVSTSAPTEADWVSHGWAVYTTPENQFYAAQWIVNNGSLVGFRSPIDGSTVSLSGTGDALVANPLSQFAATTSAQLAGVISDELFFSNGKLLFVSAITDCPSGPVTFTQSTGAFGCGSYPGGGGGGTPGGTNGGIQYNASGSFGGVVITGLVKANGTSAPGAATAGTDYLAPPSGTALLKANSGGALANATAGTDYLAPPSGTALLKANSGGALANAVAGTDYVGPTSGIAIQKANGAGGLAPATAGTDYLAPPSGAALLKANSGGALANATAGTDYLAPPSGTALLKANSGGALANAVAGTDYPGLSSDNVLAGQQTIAKPIVTTSNAMGALAIDVTKALNTKSVAADSTFTFSATGTADAPFTLIVTNTDTNPHTLTIPSSFSISRQATLTSVVIPASGKMALTWRYDGSAYQLFANDAYANKTAGTAAPTGTNDITQGYGPGSFWIDTTNHNTYVCESNTASSATWTKINGGSTSPASTNGAIQYNASGSFGGAVITGIVKGNGTSAPGAATAGTDYLAPPSGTALLKANSGGALANATAGTDYLAPPSGTALLKANSGGALANAVAGTDYTSPSSTESPTNKSFDCEATGNVCTIPIKAWLAAAGCNNATASSFWDLPTSTPAVAACVTGTNTQKGVLQFADTTGGFSAQNTLLLPADFTGNIDARIIWRTSATSGNAKWSLSTICTDVAASATDDPAFNTASTVTTAAPGTANRIQTSSITSVTATGCSAGNLLHLKLFRDGNDAADTISASADVVGVEVTFRRAM